MDVAYKMHKGIEAQFAFISVETESMFLKEIWDEEYYFAHGLDIKQGDIVLDIGAHIGLFSVLAEKKGATVHAFEPVLAYFNMLRYNLLSNVCENVVVNNMAIMAQSGEFEVQVPDLKTVKNTGTAFVGKNKAGFETQSCKAVSIHAVLSDLPKVDFMKLDCEGSEYEILYAMYPDEFKKVRQISMEFHINPKERELDALDSAKKLRTYLDTMGYETYLDWGYGSQGRLQAVKL